MGGIAPPVPESAQDRQGFGVVDRCIATGNGQCFNNRLQAGFFVILTSCLDHINGLGQFGAFACTLGFSSLRGLGGDNGLGNNGFNSGYIGGDGVSLFSTAHPLVSGGTNSNTPSTQADLNETSLEAAVIQIAAWTDERGLLIAAKPKKLIVPPALMFVADRLLETELRVGTNDNDINAIKNMGAVPEGYTVNHFLTDTNAWFLTTDVPNGMKHFVRTPLQNSMDGDFDTGNVRYKARERYSFGWSDPLGMWGSSGSS